MPSASRPLAGSPRFSKGRTAIEGAATAAGPPLVQYQARPAMTTKAKAMQALRMTLGRRGNGGERAGRPAPSAASVTAARGSSATGDDCADRSARESLDAG